MENINIIEINKQNKLIDLKRLVKELKAEFLYDEIKAKIEALETEEQAKEWDSVAYILKYKKDNEVELAKQAKLKEIQNECENIIYDKYPIYKQNNIGIFGTDEERNGFKLYKENITGQYHSFVDKVNKLKKVENIKDFSFEFQLKGE